MDDFKSDDFQEDDFQPDTIQEKPSLLQSVKVGYEMAHPLNIAKRAFDATTSIFNKAGERAAEGIGASPKAQNIFGRATPYVAAAVGTPIAMAPDIAMSFAGGVKPSTEIPKVASPYARRALGIQKSMLKTPFARGQAIKAGETALKEGVIPWSGNPETMMSRASDLAAKAELGITPVLNKTKVQIQDAISNLQNFKNQVTQGAGREGTYKGLHEAVDKIISDMSDFVATDKSVLPSNKMSAKALNVLKNRLGKSLNYTADLASQSENKGLVNNLANTIRDAVKSVVSPGEFIKFLKNQKLFSAAELMQKGLNNEIASQMGNRLVSPYSVIPATGQLAAGEPGKALATLGVGEALIRRGAGTTARLLKESVNAAPALPAIMDVATTPLRSESPISEKIIPKNMFKKKTLTEEKALEFLDQAGDDIGKAKELARQAGYAVP